MLPTFVAVTFLSFVLIHLVPGDPIEVRAGERGIDPARLAEMRHLYGFDQPLWKQFLRYEEQVASGDLGVSVVTREPVWNEFNTLFPATVELCDLRASCSPSCVGVPLGVVAAVRRGSAFDYGLMGVSVTGASMPIFWWGLMVILVFSVALGWTPVSGRISDQFYVEPWSGFMLIDSWFSDDKGAVRSAVSHLILPTIVLGTMPLATIARMTRSAMLEVLGEDYIRTARAKGLAPDRVVIIHALRNALIPVVTGARPSGRRSARRRDPDRDDLRLARRRALARRKHPAARLSGAARRHAADRHARDPGQSRRRRRLRLPQPADTPLMSGIENIVVAAAGRPVRCPAVCGCSGSSFRRTAAPCSVSASC